MIQNPWNISSEIGFLLNLQPLLSSEDYFADEGTQHIESIAAQLADLLEAGQLRSELDKLPIYDFSNIEHEYNLERAFQIYSYFASAYVYATGQAPSNHVPASIAIPLVALAEKVQRPPILAYASYTLANWQKIDPHGEIEVDNLRVLQKFIHKKDAAWFTLIHVDIEAKAAKGIVAIPQLLEAVSETNSALIEANLAIISASLDNMMATLSRMPEHCHPQVYYHEVRPYIFSFENIIYEGVEKFQNKPQSFVGETGAQSSIIPALIKVMGLVHEETSMTQYLRMIQAYMPKPHREFIQKIDAHRLRQYIIKTNEAPLRDAYNHTLQQILAFRKMHLRFAASYIANQSPDSIGTGGTEFMTWLHQLIDETQAQLLNN